MSDSILPSLLACPVCEKSLSITDDEMTCSACSYKSFRVGGIPWLFKDPQVTLGEWRNRVENYSGHLSKDISQIESELGESEILDSTRKRLRTYKKAKMKQNKLFRQIMQPLKAPDDVPKDLLKGLKTALPSSQRLMSYEANIFRDWGWGDSNVSDANGGDDAGAESADQSTGENQKTRDFVAKVIEKSKVDITGSEMVFLGAGTSRLPYDLCDQLNLKKAVLADINPFLLFLAKEVLEGKSVDLVEFPFAPRSADRYFVETQLKPAKKLATEFEFLLTDVLYLNLQSQSVSAIMTPWLIDIIPQDIDVFFRQLNRVLKPGGHWINFGSFAFHHQEQSICYSKEELFEVVQACGFEVLAQDEARLPYLQSPHSCHHRNEQMLSFVCKKVDETEQYEEIDYLPSWISDCTKAIPKIDLFASYVFMNQIQFEVLRAVDGQVSIEQIAAAVQSKYKMQEQQALAAVKGFFTNIYEENLFRSL